MANRNGVEISRVRGAPGSNDQYSGMSTLKELSQTRKLTAIQ